MHYSVFVFLWPGGDYLSLNRYVSITASHHLFKQAGKHCTNGHDFQNKNMLQNIFIKV